MPPSTVLAKDKSGEITRALAEAQKPIGKATGHVVAKRSYEVATKVSGIIRRIHFKPGQIVKTGALLVELVDDAVIHEVSAAKAELARKRAQLKKAELEVHRYERLAGRGTVTRVKLQDALINREIARAELMAATAALKKSEVTLNWHKLYAPFDGWISRPRTTEGAYIEAKADKGVLATIIQFDPVFVQFDIPYSIVASRLKANRAEIGVTVLRLTLPDGTRYEHSGRTVSVGFTVDKKTGSVPALAEFPNPKRVLLPGLKVVIEAFAPAR
ncbi:MAG: efflux RND transporter periplasmic adaptor subunit [Alphaproteobacteria bacterium]